MKKGQWGLVLAVVSAGIVNGLLGTGGGMVLVPLLGLLDEKDTVFGKSVALILPISLVSLILSWVSAPYIWEVLLGGALGGLLAGFFGHRVKPKWLHRIFGVIVLLGGVRFLL